MNSLDKNQKNLYQETKALLRAIVKYITILFICFLLLLFFTKDNPPNWVILVTFLMGISFFVFSEYTRLSNNNYEEKEGEKTEEYVEAISIKTKKQEQKQVFIKREKISKESDTDFISIFPKPSFSIRLNKSNAIFPNSGGVGVFDGVILAETDVKQLGHPSVFSKTKRLLDILGGLVGLTITLIIAIPILIAMQLDNPGPLLYSQIRCGLYGKRFRIWKFRSIIVNADQQKHLVGNKAQGHIFKNDNDPRITRLGRFLRRTSLDEFPQFWNVLTGDMSLVGTRPPTPDEVSKYEQKHLQRLLVKPGITGEWQVKGRSNVTDFEKIVEMDLDYQRRWSVGYDINLILRTVLVVLARKGAY